MLNTIKKLLSKQEDVKASTATSSAKTFGLMYETLPVGILELKGGKWRFYYSTVFKHQKKVAPLVDFPNVEKTYESEDLWPFFISRIPGTSRPAIKEILKKEQINEKDLAALLTRFGRKTIANPFLLTPQSG